MTNGYTQSELLIDMTRRLEADYPGNRGSEILLTQRICDVRENTNSQILHCYHIWARGGSSCSTGVGAKDGNETRIAIRDNNATS